MMLKKWWGKTVERGGKEVRTGWVRVHSEKILVKKRHARSSGHAGGARLRGFTEKSNFQVGVLEPVPLGTRGSRHKKLPGGFLSRGKTGKSRTLKHETRNIRPSVRQRGKRYTHLGRNCVKK